MRKKRLKSKSSNRICKSSAKVKRKVKSKIKPKSKIKTFVINPLTVSEVKNWMKFRMNLYPNNYIRNDIVDKQFLIYDAAMYYNVSIENIIIRKAASEIKYDYEVIPAAPRYLRTSRIPFRETRDFN